MMSSTPRFPLVTFLALTLGGVVGGAALLAQDPFGGGNEAAAPMAPAAPAAGKKNDKKQPSGPPVTQDVVILALRESNPTTPEQLTSAAQKMMDYGAHDEARRYLAQLIAAKPDVGQLAGLQRTFGSSLFFQFSANKKLAPEGAKVASAVLQAAATYHNDPARLRTLAKQASGRDAVPRDEAIVELKNAGSLSVAPLVEVLANANLPEAQAHARDALVALGKDAVEPLIGVLESSDANLKVQAIAVLTRLNASRVIPYLLRPLYDAQESPKVQAMAGQALKRLMGSVPSKHDVEEFLLRKTTDYLNGSFPLQPDADNIVTLWRWDAMANASVPRYYPATLSKVMSFELRTPEGQTRQIEEAPASAVMAALMARDLYTLFPDTPHYRRLFLVTHLEAGKLLSGLGQPLPSGANTVQALASRVGADAIEDVLTWSMKNDHVPAAIAAAEVLGNIGDANLLTARGDEPRPLALALRHPDRRLRFAAVDAILKLNPATSFAGASFVPETLGFLAGTVGSKRVLIVDPRTEQAGTLGGLFEQLGYEVDLASTGKQGIALALKQPDYEMVLLGDGVDGPDLNSTWQQLRKDPRTANMLVGFLTGDARRLELNERAAEDDLTVAFPWPQSEDMLVFQLKQMFTLAGVKFVPHAERVQQATVALDHLAQLAADPQRGKHYDLLRLEAPVIRAFENSHLTVHAAPVLGGLASPAAQKALVSVASDSNYDATDRQAAAKAFAAAVARRGLLLTTKDIRHQYDLYNASENLDAGIQQVLATVLDVIEKK